MTSAATLTFLFTDLVGSTELLARLGDDTAVNIHRQVDELLRSIDRSRSGGEKSWRRSDGEFRQSGRRG